MTARPAQAGRRHRQARSRQAATTSPSSASTSRSRRRRRASRNGCRPWSRLRRAGGDRAQRRRRSRPADVPLDILLPTGGTADARLATEIALALAAASQGHRDGAARLRSARATPLLLRGRARRLGMSVLVDGASPGQAQRRAGQGPDRDQPAARDRDPAVARAAVASTSSCWAPRCARARPSFWARARWRWCNRCGRPCC